MSEEKIMLGTPPALMLPARNYTFKIMQEHYLITIPRAGNYHELDPEFFPEEAGAFDILDETNKVLYMPALTKVLFATKKYPELGPNQFFVPYVLAFKEDTVDVVGQLVEFVPNVTSTTETLES